MPTHVYADEQSPLLPAVAHDRRLSVLQDRRRSTLLHQEVLNSLLDSTPHAADEQLPDGSTAGERLPYNNYTTVDFLHDNVKDSFRYRRVHSGKDVRSKLYAAFDSCSGWIAIVIIGSLTACVAFVVDVSVATVADWKFGYCKRNVLLNREGCCTGRTPLFGVDGASTEMCAEFHEWSNDYWKSFGIYLGFALAYGVISATATLTTRRSLPTVAPGWGDKELMADKRASSPPLNPGKVMYMAAGSGIPEIKTILMGFIIPGFFDLKVLLVKAFGAVFAVSTSMNLGKEGPFVHISGCVGYLVATCLPKYRENEGKLREMISASVASGLSVAFGAPIGGILFSYEEISAHFPRRVLWRAFMCSLSAAAVLKALNPTGTGKLVLFETDYGTRYDAVHYLVFVFLGVAGGIWGGFFSKLNFMWSKWFRGFSIIKNYPVFEVFLIVLVTVLLQFPNPMIREPGDVVIKNLLVDCRGKNDVARSWVCQQESDPSARGAYMAWLGSASAIKLILTIVTFGAKVPSGVIIPALDGGALFGRLVGQIIGGISPGLFAMVGSAAFLAGVSRMTISLAVVMFELTGELEYIVPNMIAIMVAKWVADIIASESVYDLAQNVLGHPSLDLDHVMPAVKAQNPPHLVERLIPPRETMEQITVHVDADNKVPRSVLEHKLKQIINRGFMDAGLVLVQNDIVQGYLGEAELTFGLRELGRWYPADVRVRLLGDQGDGADGNFSSLDGHMDAYDDEEYQRELVRQRTNRHSSGTANGNGRATSGNGNGNGKTNVDVSVEVFESGDLDLKNFVDRTPMLMIDRAPMEYAVESFGKLGLRHLIIIEERTGKLRGVCLKKRMIRYLEELKHGQGTRN